MRFIFPRERKEILEEGEILCHMPSSISMELLSLSRSLALSLFAAPGSCYFESQHKIRPMNLKAELSSADSNCPFISYVDSLVFAYVDSLFFLLGFFLAGKSPKRASRAASSISACRAASSCVIKSTNDGKKIKSDETS